MAPCKLCTGAVITDQKNSDFCTCHALGKAVVQAACIQSKGEVHFGVERDRSKGVIDILIAKAKECEPKKGIGMCQKHKVNAPPFKGIWPKWFHERKFKMKASNHQTYDVEIVCNKVSEAVDCDNRAYILIFRGEDPITFEEWTHTVFVIRKHGNFYDCINSWGKEHRDAKIQVPKHEVNEIYEVQVILNRR